MMRVVIMGLPILFLVIVLAFPESMITQAAHAPVVVDGETIFTITSSLGSFSSAERAAAVESRILSIVNTGNFNPDRLMKAESSAGVLISYESDPIMMVTENDAVALGLGRDVLAEERFEKIRMVLKRKTESSSIKRILFGVMKLVITVIVVLGLLWLIRILFNRVETISKTWARQKLKPLKIRSVTLLSAQQESRLVLKAVRVARILVSVIVIYAGVTIIFGIFPVTRTWSYTLAMFVYNPFKSAIRGIISYIPDFITLVVIIAIFHYSLRFIKFLFNEVEKGHLSFDGFPREWAMPTYSIVRFIGYAFMLVVIFPYLPGSDSAAFKGISVFLGVLFSLGSSSVISNAVSGVVITYMRPFTAGDRIKVGEVTGDVVEKALLVTRIRTTKNEIVTIPNASLLAGHTVNYSTLSSETGLILHSTVTIGYDVPWQNVHSMLVEAAKRTHGIKKRPEPFVLQTSLDDFYVSYQINGYTDQPNQMPAVYSELHRNIQNCFAENSIEIMSPHYRAFRDGSDPALPPVESGKQKNRRTRTKQRGKS